MAVLCCALLLCAVLCCPVLAKVHFRLCCSPQASLVSGKQGLKVLAYAALSAHHVSKHQVSTGMFADLLLTKLEKMRTSNVWAVAYATLPDNPEKLWFGANSTPGSEHPSEFERLLAKALGSQEQTATALTPAVARRLQACFSKVVRPLLLTFNMPHVIQPLLPPQMLCVGGACFLSLSMQLQYTVILYCRFGVYPALCMPLSNALLSVWPLGRPLFTHVVLAQLRECGIVAGVGPAGKCATFRQQD